MEEKEQKDGKESNKVKSGPLDEFVAAPQTDEDFWMKDEMVQQK